MSAEHADDVAVLEDVRNILKLVNAVLAGIAGTQTLAPAELNTLVASINFGNAASSRASASGCRSLTVEGGTSNGIWVGDLVAATQCAIEECDGVIANLS